MVKQWYADSLTKHYTKDLSVIELRKVLMFLQSPAGKNFVGSLKTAFADLENNPEPKVDSKYDAQIDKFMETPVGKKFFVIISEKANDDALVKIEKWGKKIDDEIEPKTKEILEKAQEFIDGN